MKKFLAIYTGSPASLQNWHKLDEATRKEKEAKGFIAWKNWGSVNGTKIKDMGGPLSKTKRVDSGGIHDIKNQMAAYTIVEAETHDEAAKLFLEHPHFALFPGDGIEIMEIMPVPGN